MNARHWLAGRFFIWGRPPTRGWRFGGVQIYTKARKLARKATIITPNPKRATKATLEALKRIVGNG